MTDQGALTERNARWHGGNGVQWGAVLLSVLFLSAGCEYPGVPLSLAAEVQTEAPTSVSPTPPAIEENPGQQSSQVAQVQSEDEPIPSPTSPISGQEPDPQPEGSRPSPDTVHIGLRDFRLDPDTVTGKAGTVTFVLKNEGRYTHDFRVEGQGIDEKAPKVGQGRTFEWQVTLSPGSYRISCPISNHADRGMVGSLTVTP